MGSNPVAPTTIAGETGGSQPCRFRFVFSFFVRLLSRLLDHGPALMTGISKIWILVSEASMLSFSATRAGNWVRRSFRKALLNVERTNTWPSHLVTKG